MPYRTEHGKHYHERFNCHGATIPCGTTNLCPCSDCCDTSRRLSSNASANSVTGAPSVGIIDFSMPSDDMDIILPSDVRKVTDMKTMSHILSSPRYERIGASELAELLSAMEQIDGTLSAEYAEMPQRATQLERVDLDDSQQMHHLMSIIRDSLQSLLDAYDLALPYDNDWESVLFDYTVIESLDEWRQLHEELREACGLVSQSSSASDNDLLEDIALFDGRHVYINREAVKSQEAQYALLRALVHESLHNLSTPRLESHETIATVATGIYRAEERQQWDDFNEGITEAISHLAADAIVGSASVEDWMKTTGRPVQYLLCSAVVEAVGLKQALSSYIEKDRDSLNRKLLLCTQGHIGCDDVNDALRAYQEARQEYYQASEIIQQFKLEEKEPDPIAQDFLKNAEDSMDECCKSMRRIFNILIDACPRSTQIPILRRTFLRWDVHYRLHPSLLGRETHHVHGRTSE